MKLDFIWITIAVKRRYSLEVVAITLAAYYDHMRHLREPIIKEMSSRSTQMKIVSSIPVGPSSSVPPWPDL
jgi:hypothetical protein